MPAPVLQLGAWRFSPDSDLLEDGAVERRLQPQVSQLLAYLAGRPGDVISRDELLREVWDGRFVSDAVLTTAIWELRTALGDDAGEPRYVETVPRRGYRLVAEVGAVAPAPSTSRGRRAAIWGAVLAGAGLLGWLLAFFTPPKDLEASPTLAVLPIQNLSGDPGQEYLADAFTETLITELARISALRVISRTSVMTFKGQTARMSQVRDELAVKTVLEGSIARSGDRLRLTAQLIDAESDHHLWSESYERRVDDVLALQTELARTVAREIRLQLSERDERRLAGPAEPSPGVEDYLSGLAYMGEERWDADRALAALERAIALDPRLAPAHADLAVALTWAAWDHLKYPKDIVARAREAAATALDLDPDLARAHFAEASIADLFDWDWAAAEVSYREAIRLNPSYALARRTFAQFLAERGRFDEGIAEAELARDCDPRNVASYRTLAWVHYLARHLDRALELYRRSAAMTPEGFGLRLELALVRSERGEHAAALEILEQLEAERPGNFPVLALLAFVHARAGETEAAQARLAQLLAIDGQGPFSPAAIAKVYAALGDRDRAFDWLERALAERSPALVQVAANPQFDPLRPDPRFPRLLRRIGLTPL